MSFANHDGVRVYWKEGGASDRPVLILGHALGTNLGLWDFVVPVLARHFHVIRLDFRGHGASDVPPGEYRMADLGGDVLAVADAVKAERFIYLGISMGGMVGLWLAEHASERLLGLAACHTTSQVDTEAYTERMAKVKAENVAALADTVMERWFTPAFLNEWHPQMVGVRTVFADTSSQGYIGCCAAIRDLDVHEKLSSIRTPTLVTVGAHDRSTPPEQGKLIADTIPGARLQTLPSAHLSCVEMPERFLGAVLPFLQEVSRGK